MMTVDIIQSGVISSYTQFMLQLVDDSVKHNKVSSVDEMMEILNSSFVEDVKNAVYDEINNKRLKNAMKALMSKELENRKKIHNN